MLPEPIFVGSSANVYHTHRSQFQAALEGVSDVIVLPAASTNTHDGLDDSDVLWYGVSVYAKHYQEVHFGLRVEADASLAGVTMRTSRVYRQLHPGLDRLIMARPQRCSGTIAFLAHASHTDDSSLVHVLVDLTAAGGHVFADTVSPETLVLSLLEGYYGEMKYNPEELVVKVGAEFQHRELSDTLGAETGDVVLVLPGPAPISWIPLPMISLGPSSEWLPLWLVPTNALDSGVALWNCRKLQVLPARHVPLDLLHQRVAHLTGISEADLSLRTFSRFSDLTVFGEPCHCVSVPIGPGGLRDLAESEVSEKDLRSLVVIDARSLGYSVKVLCIPAGLPSLHQCAVAVGAQTGVGKHLRLVVVATLEPTSPEDFRCFHVRLTSAQEPIPDLADLISIIEEGSYAPRAEGALSASASRLQGADEASNSEDSASSDDEVALRFLQIMVLALEHTPRVVEVALHTPSDTRSALNAIEFELEEDFFRSFSLLVPVYPQPAPFWGLVMALPLRSLTCLLLMGGSFLLRCHLS